MVSPADPIVTSPTAVVIPDTFKVSVSTLPATITPALAVTIPMESTFLTSSYVIVPPTDTLPVNVAVPPTESDRLQYPAHAQSQ